jgi:DNA invertase Pin-like site-specific DNA recombinase
MVLTIFACIAEFERALIRQRTEDGLRDARKRGVLFGRPKNMRPDQQQLAQELLEQGRSISEAARTFSVRSATIHQIRESHFKRVS